MKRAYKLLLAGSTFGICFCGTRHVPVSSQTATPNLHQNPADLATGREMEQLSLQGQEAYRVGDYEAALKAWGTGLDKARKAGNQKASPFF